jgi:ElaB/YqjD/DUF883 family membrane-anchored ribosome-binding protein
MMIPIRSIEHELKNVIDRADSCLKSIQTLSSSEAGELKQKLAILARIRSSAYEELNQIQHSALILEAAEYFNKINADCTFEWSWNPAQTGEALEPDLRGSIGGVVWISAEITTSPRPVGSLDSRMASTLGNLNMMDGDKYYVVRTKAMERRAESKINNNNYSISVLLIEY